MVLELDVFCFTYQHEVCQYTLFNDPFRDKIVAKSGRMFNNLQRAVCFNQRTREVDKISSITEKTIEKKSQKAIISSF